jgi:hypothetical protein
MVARLWMLCAFAMVTGQRFATAFSAHALREAAGSGEVDQAVALLAEGADPNARGDKADDAGETPLHLACIGGSARLIRALLGAGADPNARATGPHSLRMTPLTWCAYGGHDDGVEALLEGGADPNLVVDEESGLTLTALDIGGRVGDDLGGRSLRTKALLKAKGGKTADDLALEAKIGLSPKDVAQRAIDSASVVIFSKSYCPFCKKTKALFQEVCCVLVGLARRRRPCSPDRDTSR